MKKAHFVFFDMLIYSVLRFVETEMFSFNRSPETQPTEKRKDFVGNFCKDSPSTM